MELTIQLKSLADKIIQLKDKIEIKHHIQSIDDIYQFEKELLETVGAYEGK
ncbi:MULTISPECIES: hypothetical protein [unclassified Flavobacterium]|uniref:hypothetical protein n=1 Tax=unclassified Flavobacterium TaxID=196869 RepID=UPI001315462F|nr:MULTISPECIES: hypothetical protein [unclassified Flavobacterium]